MGDHYVDFAEENEDLGKKIKRLFKLLLILFYLGIWSVAIVVFWLFTSGSDGMGYSILFLYLLMPVTTLVASFLIGFGHFWGHFKWLTAPFFGFMYMMAEYLTFSMSNTLAFHKLNAPRFSFLIAGTIISLIAMGFGHLGWFLKKKLAKSDQDDESEK